MTGYDFDKTIYKGDCTVDFFFFMIFSRPYLLLFTPWFLVLFALYGAKVLSKKKFKESMFFFIPWYKNINRIVDRFWLYHANKIQDWYTKQKSDDDIVISASLSFIVKPATDMLHIKNLIATNFSTSTGKIIGENCYGEAKKIEFEKNYPRQKLEAYYSDSLSDMPLFKSSKKAFLVAGSTISELEKK